MLTWSMYMKIKLLRVTIDDVKEIHEMQVQLFKELLKKYQDFDISPANENIEKIEERMK